MGSINANVATTTAFLKDNPAAVEAVVHGLIDATDALMADKKKLFERAKELFKKNDKVVELAMKNTILDYKVDPRAVESLVDWQVKLGYIKSKPDTSAIVDTRILNRLLQAKS